MGKSVVMSPQHASRLVPLVIEGADGSPVLTEGILQATVADTDVGVYTVAFNDAFARAPVVVATAVIASTGVELIANIRAVSTSGFVVEVNDDAGTAADADVHVLVFGFDSADRG